MNLYIAIPSCRDWKPHFGASLCGLVHVTTKSGINFTLNCMKGTSVLPKARQMAMEHAIQESFTHLLFLDDDMSFSPDLAIELLKHEKAIVGINYVTKMDSPKPQTHNLAGEPLSSKDKDYIEEVGWIGFGGVLIELSSVKDMPKPWFEMRWLPERNSFLGEDYYFCGKARSHGLRIYVDHTQSNKVAHVGDFSFREQ